MYDQGPRTTAFDKTYILNPPLGLEFVARGEVANSALVHFPLLQWSVANLDAGLSLFTVHRKVLPEPAGVALKSGMAQSKLLPHLMVRYVIKQRLVHGILLPEWSDQPPVEEEGIPCESMVTGMTRPICASVMRSHQFLTVAPRLECRATLWTRLELRYEALHQDLASGSVANGLHSVGQWLHACIAHLTFSCS
eukprot:6490760-Amphidinium_carterae.2